MRNRVFAEDVRKYGNAVHRTAASGNWVAIRRGVLTQTNERDGVWVRPGDTRCRSIRQVQSHPDGDFVAGDGVRVVRASRAAGKNGVAGCGRNCLQVIAGLRIAVVDVVRRQQSVPLRSDISDLKEDVARQFAFDGQVVLRGILRAQNFWKLAEEQDRTECFPVNGRATRRAKHAVEWIRPNRSVLVKKRSLESRVCGEVASAEWWLRAE